MSWTDTSLAKIIDPLDLAVKVDEIRTNGKTIVTLNGSFDLLHAGHLHIIFEASKLANVLIVALNSDRSIKSYKGKDRPIIPLKYRMEMMAALEFVNYVTSFDETDPCKLLNVIKPDVHVNGAEYGENCIESETVKANGGVIHIIPLIDGLSTSMIINKIHQLKSL